MRAYKLLLALSVFLFTTSCGDEQFVPKPSTYKKLEMPAHTYTTNKDDCPYVLTLSDAYSITPVKDQNGGHCHKDIKLGALNGTLHLSYIDMVEPLSTYVNYINDKVDEHKIKASGISTQVFIDSTANTYSTLFELKGDVASPFQFFVTDSTDRFISGVVYFNHAPNYDSLKPSLDYLKVDIEKMITTLEWK